MKSIRHTHLALLSFCLVAIYSCGTIEDVGEEEVKYEPSAASKFQSFKMNLESPKIDFAELVDEVQVVRLEETENSLLGSASNLVITDKYLVTCDTRKGDFYIFDRNGHFINSFNRLGDGPEEVVRVWGYWVVDDQIVIHDAARSQVVAYNLNGEYLSKFDLPYEQTNHLKPDGDYLWIEVSTVYLEDSVMAQLSRYTIDTGEDSLFLIQGKRAAFDMPTTMSSFSTNSEGIIYKRFLSDSAFILKNGGVEPLVHFDFGDEFLWQGEALSINPQKGFELLQSTEKVWQVWPYIGDDWVYLRYHRSMRAPAKFMVVNLRTGLQYEIDKPTADEGGYFYNERLWYNGQFVIDMNSTDVATFLGELDESQIKFREGSSLAEIESSENPALIFVTFKNTIN